MVEPSLEQRFPGLRAQPYRITSPTDSHYNCIAWAAGSDRNWWWPDSDDEDAWPEGITREETLAAFQELFASLGYEVCDHEHLEAGFEKIALFALENEPKHAARQLANGRWTSKLGHGEDIEHALHDLRGTLYGSAMLFMKRPNGATDSSTLHGP